MSLKSVVKKVVKASLNPTTIFEGGITRSVIRDERKERIKEQQANAEREKTLLGEKMAAEEEERRRRKTSSLGQRTTGLASLIGSSGNTLG